MRVRSTTQAEWRDMLGDLIEIRLEDGRPIRYTDEKRVLRADLDGSPGFDHREVP